MQPGLQWRALQRFLFLLYQSKAHKIKKKTHKITCSLSTSRQGRILTYVFQLSQSLIKINKFDANTETAFTLKTCYLARTVNVTSSVNVGIVFNF